MDKQGNLIPDAHYIFSVLPDSSLSAEGESLTRTSNDLCLALVDSPLLPGHASMGCMLGCMLFIHLFILL